VGKDSHRKKKRRKKGLSTDKRGKKLSEERKIPRLGGLSALLARETRSPRLSYNIRKIWGNNNSRVELLSLASLLGGLRLKGGLGVLRQATKRNDQAGGGVVVKKRPGAVRGYRISRLVHYVQTLQCSLMWSRGLSREGAADDRVSQIQGRCLHNQDQGELANLKKLREFSPEKFSDQHSQHWGGVTLETVAWAKEGSPSCERKKGESKKFKIHTAEMSERSVGSVAERSG